MDKVNEAIELANQQFQRVYKPDQRAFPVAVTYQVAEGQVMMLGSPGLSKRELVAAMAMQSLISEPGSQATLDETAGNACAYADALLARLDAVPTTNPPGSCL